jgi:hypothetical protein
MSNRAQTDIEIMIGDLTCLLGVQVAVKEILLKVVLCVGAKHRKMSMELLAFFGCLVVATVGQFTTWKLWVNFNPHIPMDKILCCALKLRPSRKQTYSR